MCANEKMSAPEFADVQLHAAQPSKNGKQAPLTRDGESWYITLPGSYSTSFNATAFQDPEANRVTLSITADEGLQQIAKDIDQCLLEKVRKDPAKYLGKALTAAEADSGYTPILRTNGDYSPLVKVKLQKEGRYAVRCWSKTGERMQLPEDWREVLFTPRVWIKGLWVAQGGRNWGAQLEMIDCQIESQQVACPF